MLTLREETSRTPLPPSVTSLRGKRAHTVGPGDLQEMLQLWCLERIGLWNTEAFCDVIYISSPDHFSSQFQKVTSGCPLAREGRSCGQEAGQRWRCSVDGRALT